MNAAFVLVTTAWLAGADAAPPAAPDKPATPAATSSVSGACGACCEESKHGRLKGLWGRLCSSHDDCNTCAKPAPTPKCDTGCEKESCLDRLKHRFHSSCDKGCDTCAKPAPTPKCDSCCDKESFLDRIKHRLHSSCDKGCDTCAKPAPTPKCDTGCEKECFLDRLKGRFHSSCDKGCDKCADKCAKPAPVVTGGCGACCEESRPNCFERLRARLRSHDDCCQSPCASGTKPEPIKAPKDGDTGKKLPEGGKEANLIPTDSAPIITPVSGTSEKESPNPFELSHQYESRAGCAPDYSWLTGQLFYVHADGGLWVLRYAPVSKEDANGGGVVLARDLRMDSYREGDLVTVHGEVIGKKSSIFLGGPLYRGKTIELIERDKQ